MSGAAGALDPRTAPTFPMAARSLLEDTQLRKNVRHATEVIQAKRGRVVAEMPDWQALREAGRFAALAHHGEPWLLPRGV